MKHRTPFIWQETTGNVYTKAPKGSTYFLLAGHCRDHFTFLPETPKGDQKDPNLKWKKKIIVAD